MTRDAILSQIRNLRKKLKIDLIKNVSGLGLYMSKLIIERKALRTLSVSNTKQGTSFTIVLNLA